MELIITQIIKAVILPPSPNLIVMLLGVWYMRRRPRLARGLIGCGLLSLWLCTSDFIAGALARQMEFGSPDLAPFDLRQYALSEIQHTAPEAIVVPGRGRYIAAPEYHGTTVSIYTLERVRYAAYLHRATGLPLAVVGGAPIDAGPSEGELMQGLLEKEFQLPVTWVETESLTTGQNAINARRLIPANRIILVTHALDMPRAKKIFEAVGFTVVPAPMGYITRKDYGIDLTDLFPSALALITTRAVCYEWLGALWYRFRYDLAG